MDEIVVTFFLNVLPRCPKDYFQIVDSDSSASKNKVFFYCSSCCGKPRQALPAAGCTGSALGSTLGRSKLLVAPQPIAAHDVKRGLRGDSLRCQGLFLHSSLRANWKNLEDGSKVKQIASWFMVHGAGSYLLCVCNGSFINISSHFFPNQQAPVYNHCVQEIIILSYDTELDDFLYHRWPNTTPTHDCTDHHFGMLHSDALQIVKMDFFFMDPICADSQLQGTAWRWWSSRQPNELPGASEFEMIATWVENYWSKWQSYPNRGRSKTCSKPTPTVIVQEIEKVCSTSLWCCCAVTRSRDRIKLVLAHSCDAKSYSIAKTLIDAARKAHLSPFHIVLVLPRV